MMPSCMYQVLVKLNLGNNYDIYSFGIQDSEKEATKQRISELEEMIIQLRDELKEKVNTHLYFFTVWWHMFAAL